jgi:hypothetical protein
VTEPAIGSQKKRDIAYVIASLLDRDRKYSHSEIEQLVRDNVRPIILEIPGLAADHIRLSMIECGFVHRDAKTNQTWVSPDFTLHRDAKTNQTWVSPDFTRDHDHHARISKQLELQSENYPNQEFDCPECNLRLRARPLFTHYVKKHAGKERWEEIVDAYFGWV